MEAHAAEYVAVGWTAQLRYCHDTWSYALNYPIPVALGALVADLHQIGVPVGTSKLTSEIRDDLRVFLRRKERADAAVLRST